MYIIPKTIYKVNSFVSGEYIDHQRVHKVLIFCRSCPYTIDIRGIFLTQLEWGRMNFICERCVLLKFQKKLTKEKIKCIIKTNALSGFDKIIHYSFND